MLDPFKSFHCKHPPHLPRGAPSESRVLAFLHAPPTDTAPGRRDRALFEFLYGTGLRVGEMQWVEIGHLNFQTMQLRVDRGKGQLSRILPIGPHLAAVLQDYLANTRPVLARKDHQALFLNNIGQRLVAGLAMTYVRNYAKSLDFRGFSAHMLRHAFATHLLQRGAPIVAVQRLLGHVTPTMTTRYVHLVAADLQGELRRTHPRAKRRKRRQIKGTDTEPHCPVLPD